jgi:hypothetical protein
VTILAQLGPVISLTDKSSSLITPVIAHLNREDYDPKFNATKVDYSLDIETVRFLQAADHHRSMQKELYHHCFEFGKERRCISGVTSYLAITIASMMHSRLPDFEFDREMRLTGTNYTEFNEWILFEKSDQFYKKLE